MSEFNKILENIRQGKLQLDSTLNRQLLNQVKFDRPIVEAFCSVYQTLLVDVRLSTDEPEAIYVFSDNLGGYTIEALEWSLEENNIQSYM